MKGTTEENSCMIHRKRQENDTGKLSRAYNYAMQKTRKGFLNTEISMPQSNRGNEN